MALYFWAISNKRFSKNRQNRKIMRFRWWMYMTICVQCESKIPSPCGLRFSDIFDKRLRILNQFLHTYCTFLSTLDYKFLFNYYSVISNGNEVMPYYHIYMPYSYAVYPVHVICSKCPPSAETHAFRRLRKSLIAMLIAICGKSSQICWF